MKKVINPRRSRRFQWHEPGREGQRGASRSWTAPRAWNREVVIKE